MRLIALSFIALLGLAGCGQKGPLYLPEPAESNQPTQAADESRSQE